MPIKLREVLDDKMTYHNSPTACWWSGACHIDQWRLLWKRRMADETWPPQEKDALLTIPSSHPPARPGNNINNNITSISCHFAFVFPNEPRFLHCKFVEFRLKEAPVFSLALSTTVVSEFASNSSALSENQRFKERWSRPNTDKTTHHQERAWAAQLAWWLLRWATQTKKVTTNQGGWGEGMHAGKKVAFHSERSGIFHNSVGVAER